MEVRAGPGAGDEAHVHAAGGLWLEEREGGGAVTLTDPAGDVRVEASALVWKK
jgi:hypothetical protein